MQVNWVGSIQTSDFSLGLSKTLEHLNEYESQYLIQNFKKAEGSWRDISDQLSQDWTTRALNCGLKYCAYVFSAKITAQMATVHLGSTSLKYEFRRFPSQKSAEEWLSKMIDKNN